MSVSAEVLRTLHRIHRQQTDLRERLARGPRQIKVGEANHAKIEAELEAARQLTRQMRVSADQKQLQLREREGRLVDLRGKLNAAASNREYQALLEQIAADEQANNVLSDEILELLEKVDAQLLAGRQIERRYRRRAQPGR